MRMMVNGHPNDEPGQLLPWADPGNP
ncbi:hypothetical protein [Bradyrhizobium sp. CSA112]|nr:hypothetical protein [Bradyrhizobium sp. CSA112]